MRFAVETWSPDYDASVPEGELGTTDAQVDPGLELPLARWRPLRPEPSTGAGPVAFVDGVRRIDARVWIHDGDTARAGVCASVAAGAVLAEPGAARVVTTLVERGLFCPAAAGAGPIVTAKGTYALRPTAAEGVESAYLAIHERMTACELEVSAGLDVEVAVLDGPLRGRAHPTGVGYVKTQHVRYLPEEAHEVLGRLGAGERTPLFVIQGGGVTRWSWYLRLPGPVAHPLSGVVRCEVPGAGTLEEAAARADRVSALLPRFASVAHKDARAPQNLYPIAGLEAQLRRRLGDPQIMERALRVAAAAASSARADG